VLKIEKRKMILKKRIENRKKMRKELSLLLATLTPDLKGYSLEVQLLLL